MPFGFLALTNLKVLLAFQSYDFECTRRRFLQKRAVHTKLDIYVFIICKYTPENTEGKTKNGQPKRNEQHKAHKMKKNKTKPRH